MFRQRRLSTSLRRHPVSAGSRIAATASGHSASRASSARLSRASSSMSRKWATCFLGFFAIPGQGLELRSRNPHSSARFIIARRIAKARLAAPGFRLHPLKGDRAGQWSDRVSGNWRVVFRFEDGEAADANLTDYH